MGPVLLPAQEAAAALVTGAAQGGLPGQAHGCTQQTIHRRDGVQVLAQQVVAEGKGSVL